MTSCLRLMMITYCSYATDEKPFPNYYNFYQIPQQWSQRAEYESKVSLWEGKIHHDRTTVYNIISSLVSLQPRLECCYDTKCNLYVGSLELCNNDGTALNTVC